MLFVNKYTGNIVEAKTEQSVALMLQSESYSQYIPDRKPATEDKPVAKKPKSKAQK